MSYILFVVSRNESHNTAVPALKHDRVCSTQQHFVPTGMHQSLLRPLSKEGSFSFYSKSYKRKFIWGGGGDTAQTALSTSCSRAICGTFLSRGMSTTGPGAANSSHATLRLQLRKRKAVWPRLVLQNYLEWHHISISAAKLKPPAKTSQSSSVKTTHFENAMCQVHEQD